MAHVPLLRVLLIFATVGDCILCAILVDPFCEIGRKSAVIVVTDVAQQCCTYEISQVNVLEQMHCRNENSYVPSEKIRQASPVIIGFSNDYMGEELYQKIHIVLWETSYLRHLMKSPLFIYCRHTGHPYPLLLCCWIHFWMTRLNSPNDCETLATQCVYTCTKNCHTGFWCLPTSVIHLARPQTRQCIGSKTFSISFEIYAWEKLSLVFSMAEIDRNVAHKFTPHVQNSKCSFALIGSIYCVHDPIKWMSQW